MLQMPAHYKFFHSELILEPRLNLNHALQDSFWGWGPDKKGENYIAFKEVLKDVI